MRKTITYSTFFVATIMVIALFVTSKNYTQLGFAVLLYPIVAYLALNLFPRKLTMQKDVTIKIPTPAAALEKVTDIDVTDHDKRAFLKLIGVAGISVFLFSIFSKRGQIPFFGKMAGSDTVSLKDSKGKTIDPAQAQPLDGFQISEIDDGIITYYGFINKDGSWFIMKEDTETSSFRYAKGNSKFPNGWSNRTRLKYDYFYNV